MSHEGIPHLADRLNHLFRTVPRQVGTRARHSNESVVRELDGYGVSVTPTHLSHLRSGRRDNPSARLLAGLARVFGVPYSYFFDAEVEKRVNEELEVLTAFRDPRVRELAVLASDVSAANLDHILLILGEVRRIEGIDSDGAPVSASA